MRSIIKTGLAVALGAAIAAPAFAIDTGIKGLTQNGRIKAGVSVLYDLPNQGDKIGPSQWLIESKTTYRPSRSWTFIANFWLRGDLQSEISSYDAPNGGLTGPGLSPFTNSNFNLNDKNCSSSLSNQCAKISELDVLDDWEDVIRELSVKYRDRKGRYSIKFGKQQRGWGESDGLRLIDVLHAQDLRERFAFKNSDELRIPALMLSADFNLSKLGMAGPFEALGMGRPSIEFNFTPEVHHSAFIINNPTPTDRSSGGAFGLPWPDTKDPVSEFGYLLFGFETPENEARKLSFSDAEYSLRLKFNTLGGVASLNAFYGMQDLPVLKLRGGDVYIGDGLNGAAGTSIIPPIHIGAQDVEAIVHGAGTGYLDFMRGLAGKGPVIPNPLSVATALLGLGANGCVDPTGIIPTGTQPCSLVAQAELDYDYRQMLIGATFTRDLSDIMSFGRKNSSPSIRLEMSHEFDHPFNRSVVDPEAQLTAGLAGALGVPTNAIDASSKVDEYGTGAVSVISSRAILKSDITSTMIGFDFPFWVPGWDSQEKSIFTSFQLFDIYTHEADQGLMAQAPYAYAAVEDHQNYSTFLWSMPLDSQRLILEGLILRDFTNEGLVYRQRVDFNYFGDSWRPRLEWMHFSGKKESAPAGMFNNSDFIELSLTYQF